MHTKLLGEQQEQQPPPRNRHRLLQIPTLLRREVSLFRYLLQLFAAAEGGLKVRFSCVESGHAARVGVAGEDKESGPWWEAAVERL